MTEIFNMPENQACNAYKVITDQVKLGLPLNMGLIFNKYANKFVTGYFNNREEWENGKQSEIKRQIYLLRKERIDVQEKLKEIMNVKGNTIVTYKEKGKYKKKKLNEILGPIDQKLNECDIDEVIDEVVKNLRRIQDKSILNELQMLLKKLSEIKLAVLFSGNSEFYQTIYKRLESILNGLKHMMYQVEVKEFKLSQRLIINLGSASIYETSLLFHRNYSFPYIPGSAVKGVTKHWAIQKFAEELHKKTHEGVREVYNALETGNELRIECDGINFKELIEIFGTQDKKGEVIFFDAFPIIKQNQVIQVALDVMNVHYRDYYQDEEPKKLGDWMEPVPIFFLAVEKGTIFKFALASRKKPLVEITMKLLKEALGNFGIGAKTSLGYGFFNIV
ncbi:MAG: type III-B CRISPR module RAMP protein Cmr6 [Candidatus Bathyarchaeia archaeon]